MKKGQLRTPKSWVWVIHEKTGARNEWARVDGTRSEEEGEEIDIVSTCFFPASERLVFISHATSILGE